jgi:hypothetical protein
MIEEIIYTSAPKGLKAGSRGFCTVVSTAGMAVNTAERLESMSGYRHAFPMQDPKAPLNPVNYSHVTLRIGGRNVHVISRVADAGQDYSGRTNKLAHHLVIDDVSRFIAGPVRLMAETGVLVSQWDGNTRNVPPRKLPSPAIPPSIELQAWKMVTGDSGWAGWAAEQLTKDKSPVSVIFAAGTDTFSLVREVLDLLPPAQRWSITFSTYFTKLLAGTECQLRFVLDDTPEATALRNDARAKLVDLTSTLKPATGGPIVTQARGGRIVMTESPPPVQRQAAPGRPAAALRAEQAPVVEDMDIEIPALRSTKHDVPGFQSPTLPPAIAHPFDSKRPTKKRSSGWWKYAVGAILLVASSSLITFFVVKQMNHGAETTTSEASGHRGSDQTVANGTGKAVKSSTSESVGSGDGNAASAAVAGKSRVESPQETSGKVESTESASLEVAAVAGGELSKEMSDTESQSNVPPADPPKPLKVEEVDPFRLVLADTHFEYPNHPDLLLFELPTRTENSKSTTPPIPLLLREDDHVELLFHENFKHLIHHRTVDGKTGTDIRLTASSAPTDSQKSWKATLWHEETGELEFGTYTLKRQPPGQSLNSPSHQLEFAEGKLCESTNQGEQEYADLFRFCPLIISIARKSAPLTCRVFCQTRGVRGKNTQGNGVWAPEPNRSRNRFQHLAVLEFEPQSKWNLMLEVVTLSADKERRRHSEKIEFEDKSFSRTIDDKHVSFIRRDNAAGNLFSTISDDPGSNLIKPILVSSAESVDGIFGFVIHKFEWRFTKVDEKNPSIPFAFSVNKQPEGVLQLPWIPDNNESIDQSSKATFPKLLSEADQKLATESWRVSANSLSSAAMRLHVSTLNESAIKKNAERLASKLASTGVALSKKKEQIETEKKKLGGQERQDA